MPVSLTDVPTHAPPQLSLNVTLPPSRPSLSPPSSTIQPACPSIESACPLFVSPLSLLLPLGPRLCQSVWQLKVSAFLPLRKERRRMWGRERGGPSPNRKTGL